MLFVELALSACDDPGDEEEALPEPPAQAALEDGVIDVCHRWPLDLYEELFAEYLEFRPEKDYEMFYIEQSFPMAACTTTYPGLATGAATETQIGLAKGEPSAAWEITTLYGELLGAEGFAAIWNNAMRGAASHPDYEYSWDEKQWQRMQEDLQEALGQVLATSTSGQLVSAMPTDFMSGWIETGNAVVQTRSYGESSTNWATFASRPYDPGEGGWDYTDWEVEVEGPQVYGWSILAPLLRFGDFNEDFLIPVATAIIEFDQAHGGNWLIEGEEPISFDAFDSDPADAMDAVLEALERNPTAALAVYETTGDDRLGAMLDRIED